MQVFKSPRVIGILLFLILIILGVVIFRASKTQEEQIIKIGAVYPLTGPLATYGIEYRRGLEMAAEELNDQGGIYNKRIQIIFEDDEGDVAKSVSAVNKLIDVDRVKFLFTGFSSPSQATAPIAEQHKVLYISQTVSKIGTGSYVFRDYWDMEDQGAAIGLAVVKEGVKRLGIVALNYGDTEAFFKGLTSEAEGVVLQEERFNFGDSDFRTQLTKIKNFKPEGILVYGFPGNETAKITEQIKELNLDSKRLFSGSTYTFPFMYQKFFSILQKMRAIDTGYSLDSRNPKAEEFKQKYSKKHNQELIGDAAYPYDDLYALKQAMETAESTEDARRIADTLRKIEYDGVAGKLTFDEKGNSRRKAYLQVFGENGWEKYEID